jgi:hypothetical protein
LIGLQDLVIKNNVKVYELAKEINCSPSEIYKWFRNNKVPKSRLKILSERFHIEEDYLNKVINDINTYKPKKIGFCNEYKIKGKITILYLEKKNEEIYETIIDTEDLDKLIKYNNTWHTFYSATAKTNYVAATKRRENSNKYNTVYLHRLLTDAPPDSYVDHINHNTLDNRKKNLRITTNDKNTRHRRSKNSNNKSGYRNVCWSESDNKWIVQLQINGKNTVLGYFNDVHEAGKFAKEMRKKYYKKYAGES